MGFSVSVSAPSKYAAEFKTVDLRLAGYLNRYLKRAMQGPEQERQLLQVLQVELRDMLRRVLDSEQEVTFLEGIVQESHKRLAETSNFGEHHLEKIVAMHEEKVRALKVMMGNEQTSKVGQMEAIFKREIESVEARVRLVEDECAHKNKEVGLSFNEKLIAKEADVARKVKG